MKSRPGVLFALLLAILSPVESTLAEQANVAALNPSVENSFEQGLPSQMPPTPCFLAKLDPESRTFTPVSPGPGTSPGSAASNGGPADGALPRANLNRPKPVIPLGCNRPFLYRGDLYSVDSPHAQDVETLKYFTRDTSEAQTLLNTYQDNRARARVSAYTGTIGVVLALFSSGIGRWLNPRNPDAIRTAAIITGLAVAAEGYSYSIMLLRSNDALMQKAVDTHNQQHPNDPIELQFSTSVNF